MENNGDQNQPVLNLTETVEAPVKTIQVTIVNPETGKQECVTIEEHQPKNTVCIMPRQPE